MWSLHFIKKSFHFCLQFKKMLFQAPHLPLHHGLVLVIVSLGLCCLLYYTHGVAILVFLPISRLIWTFIFMAICLRHYFSVYKIFCFCFAQLTVNCLQFRSDLKSAFYATIACTMCSSNTQTHMHLDKMPQVNSKFWVTFDEWFTCLQYVWGDSKL